MTPKKIKLNRISNIQWVSFFPRDVYFTENFKNPARQFFAQFFIFSRSAHGCLSSVRVGHYGEQAPNFQQSVRFWICWWCQRQKWNILLLPTFGEILLYFFIERRIKNKIYLIVESLSCLPIQFRNPKEKGQTRMSLLNSPLTTNRSGLNISGSGKIFGLCITEVSDAWNINK